MGTPNYAGRDLSGREPEDAADPTVISAPDVKFDPDFQNATVKPDNPVEGLRPKPIPPNNNDLPIDAMDFTPGLDSVNRVLDSRLNTSASEYPALSNEDILNAAAGTRSDADVQAEKENDLDTINQMLDPNPPEPANDPNPVVDSTN